MAESDVTWEEDHARGDDDGIVRSTRLIPWLVPLCGAAMIFCLALVAVFFGAPN
ncbi:MAG: hypothetical protein WCZ18_01575 [Ottowia sp.]|nr:hypothetical protein [Ottowia sp.]